MEIQLDEVSRKAGVIDPTATYTCRLALEAVRAGRIVETAALRAKSIRMIV